MKRVTIARLWSLIGVGFVLAGGRALPSDLDTVGATLLQGLVTNLDGSGIAVLQPEAGAGTATNWQVDPSVLGQPGAAFTYSASAGSTNRFPNSLGASSGHAGAVAENFHAVAAGAPRLDNCEANYFYSFVVEPLAAKFADPLANQSFTFGNVSVSSQQAIDWNFDNYASQYNTLFISAANNGGAVSPPGTSYNCIGVGAYGGSSSVGPTIDNGRAKPDLTAPGSSTSFSTPLVTGAAALLQQAGLRGDGGDTNSAVDMRVTKALLLNGAIKPADWTNQAPSPLDARYGAGVLNVFNSYQQLAAGKHAFSVATFCATNTTPDPAGEGNAINVLSGWDFNTNASVAASNGVNHYYFNVTNGVAGSTFTATATLVWNRHLRTVGINNLDLFLYAAGSGALVACSTSLVDNVEHVYLPRLPQGSYDLQVVKNGGVMISATEPYALAFEFFSTPLNVAASAAGTVLTWPVYPAGFTLQTASGLASPPVWISLTNLVPVVTNGQNCVVLPATDGIQIFRLSRQ
jgi:hypothetical protein